MARRRTRRAGHRRRRSMRRVMIVLAATAGCLAAAGIARFAWRRHTDAVAVLAHNRRADSLLAASHLEAAAQEWRQSLSIDRDEPTATRQLALVYSRLAENTQAQFYLARAIARKPRDIPLREQLAFVYFTSGNLDAAREEAVALRDLDANNATALRILRATARHAGAETRDSVERSAPFSLAADAEAGPRATQLRRTQRALADRLLDSAAARASRVLDRWPDDVEALVLRADASLAKSDTAAAARDLRHALQNDSTLPGARVRLAAVELREGAFAAARSALEAATSYAGPAYPEAGLALADLDVRSGAAPRAINILERLIASRPRSRRAYEQLGLAHLAMGKPRPALQAFERAAAFDSTDPRGSYGVGLAFLAQGKRSEARRAFERSIGIAPEFLEPTVKLVEMDLADKRPRDAIARIQAAITRAPQSAALYGLLGTAYSDAGDAPAAEAALRRAIELNPSAEEARLHLATVQGAAGRNDAAMASLATVLQSNPRSPRALMLSGVAYEQRGDVQRAREAYEQALALDSLMPAAANNLAVLLMKHGKPADRARALRLAETAYRAAPGDPNVADTFGWILYQAALTDPVQPRRTLGTAVQLLQQSAKQMPENGEVAYHLGLALRFRGDTAGSKAALEAAIRAPGPPALRDSARMALESFGRR